MHNKIIFICALVLASGSVMADTAALEAIGKQAVKDSAAAVAPEAVNKAAEVNEALDAAKNTAESIPAVTTEQAKQAVTDTAVEKAKQAVPAETTKALDTVEQGKAALDAAPKSTGEAVKAVKTKAKQKAAAKALDLLK